jgi:UDP-N-acetylmuramyl pentapeptide phosphotransferase/UDP-N-acetylglucosamine-1-phosphate transferase
MGDVGSAFLGFSFAAMPFLGGATAPKLALPAALMIWPFLFDATLTLLRRIRRQENLFVAHRSHLYQRLNIARYPHRFVTIVYAAFAVLTAALAVVVPRLVTGGVLGAFAAAIAAGLGLWRFVLHVEKSSDNAVIVAT